MEDKFTSLLTNLIINATNLDIPREEVIEMLGLGSSATKQLKREYLSNNLTLKYDDVHSVVYNAVKNSSEQSIDSLVSRLSNDILNKKAQLQEENECFSKMRNILAYLENNGIKQATLLEKFSIAHPADDMFFSHDFSKAKRRLKEGKVLGNIAKQRLEQLHNFVASDQKQAIDSFSLTGIRRFYQSKLDNAFTHCPTLDTLVGTYIMVKRSNLKEESRLRGVLITTLEIFKVKGDEYQYKCVSLEKNNGSFIHRGIIFRDSNHSIKLLGYKKSPSNQHGFNCMEYLSLSVSNTERQERCFYNGAYSELEDSHVSKPYHTWIHLSRIRKPKKFFDDIKKTSYSSRHYNESISQNFNTIMFNLDRDDFKKAITAFGNKKRKGQSNEVKMVCKIYSHLSDEYKFPKENKKPIKYTFDKLFLDSEEKGLNIL